ncbi:hypothetical protein EIP86_006443 [Pleurotus ostreatoroseus]|nr:hypothetical protein EIP86_006443 [Pleurotus ostreatoroseus]
MGPLLSTPAAKPPSLSTLLVTSIPLSPAHLARLRTLFATVHHHPARDTPPPREHLAAADVLYGFPPAALERRAQAPRLRLVQLASAGAERVVASPIWREEGGGEGEGGRIALATAAGVHTGVIPQYFICTVLALYSRLQEQLLVSQNERRWGADGEFGSGAMFVQELRGKTVGVLGYGHIGREAARLAAAFGARVIAANTSGVRTPQEGYIVPGTGDPDGSIPAAWYASSSPAALAAFLSATDILLLALPSTPATHHILSARTLPALRPSSILVNIGRGDSVDTPALLHALDTRALAGAALDVTDPEPLPAGHPLFGRPNVIVTPHLSGRTVRYWDVAIDILEENVRRMREGREVLNRVDVDRGY